MKWPKAEWYARSKMPIVVQLVDLISTPFLETFLNKMECPGGEMTELAADTIAESMNTKCDVDIN